METAKEPPPVSQTDSDHQSKAVKSTKAAAPAAEKSARNDVNKTGGDSSKAAVDGGEQSVETFRLRLIKPNSEEAQKAICVVCKISFADSDWYEEMAFEYFVNGDKW